MLAGLVSAAARGASLRAVATLPVDVLPVIKSGSPEAARTSMSSSALRVGGPSNVRAQPPAQLGIVGLPDPLPFFNREQVDIAASESELEQTGLARTGPLFHRGLARVCPGNDLVDASALLGAPGPLRRRQRPRRRPA